jgi:T5SS/PEP-CTERM-associated repeat protein
MKRWNRAVFGLMAIGLVLVIGVRTGTGINVPPCTPPSITAQPSSQTYCIGGRPTFGFWVVATGSSPLSYQWRKGGTNISGATTAMWFPSPVTTNSAGSYDAVVANACGSVTSRVAILTVTNAAPPTITSQPPSSQTVCAGQTASFSVIASFASSYQWYTNGVNIVDGPTGHGSTYSGANSATLRISNVSTADAVSTSSGYYCEIWSPCCCGFTVTSSKAGLTVNVLPLVYSVSGGGSYCSGGLGVTVGLNSSQSGVYYQLKRDGSNTGSPVTGTGSAISFGLQTVAGTYTVLAVNATTGCSATMNGSATVTVNPLPTATVNGGGTICGAQSAIIRAALTGTGPWTVTWSDGFTQSNVTASPATRAVSPASTTTYTVATLSDSKCTGGTVSGNATVTVITVPAAPYTADYQTNTISGVASNWVGDYIVGSCNFADVLIITNAGKLIDDSGYLGYTGSSSNNSALVGGSGSVWSNQPNLVVGRSGSGNSLVISNGGKVFIGNIGWNSYGYIGLNHGSDSNSVLVTGTGSVWSNWCTPRIIGIGPNEFTYLFAYLYVGEGGSGNSLIINDGGKVFDDDGHIGLNYGSDGNKVLVTGSGSVWSSGGVVVGSFGSGNSLVISNGGNALCGGVCIGNYSSSTNNSVLVADTVWNSASEFTVGYDGSGNSLVISNGGKVLCSGSLDDSSCSWIGIHGSNNSVVVTGTGSVWSNLYYLDVGWEGSGNSLVISNGGKVFDWWFGSIGTYDESSNNSAVVTGSGSVWRSEYDVDVGYYGSSNSLVINNGGTVVASTNGNIGIGWDMDNNLGNNNSVVVTGSGSVWSNGQSLFVGTWGSGNSLVISNGGKVVSSDLFVGYRPGSSNNAVVLNDGNLVVTNALGNGALDIRKGVFTMNGPNTIVEVEQLVATNGASSVIIFNGGTLMTKMATIGNGAVLQFALGTNSPGVSVNGNLTLGGTLNITDAGGLMSGMIYTLFTYSGTLTYNGLTIGTAPTGYNYAIDISTAGQIKLIVVPPPPVANFSGSPTSGVAPFAVTFTDASTGNITNRFWSFGDGNTTNTTATSMSHTYAAGAYTVSLTVGGLGGSNTSTRTNYIVVVNPPAPVASFSGSPTNGVAPLAVTFVDASTGNITNRFWNFGDGNTTNTTAVSMNHTYVAGTYTVSLTVRGLGGSDTSTRSSYIVALTPAHLVISPASCDYGTIIVGQTSNQTFSVINTGQQTLTGSASIGTPFVMISGSPYSVAGNGTNTVTVGFSPVAAGSFTSAVIFASNGGDSTNTVTGTGGIVPVVTTNPSDQTVYAYYPASFTAAASGSPTPTVQWQVSTNGGATFSDWVGKTNTTLSFITAIGDNGRKYRAVFSNPCGSATSGTATLTVLISPNPIGWWKFDEGVGTNAADSSGNGNDGTLINGPTWVTGILSNALSFDGSSYQYVQVQPTATVNGTFTVAAWLLPLDPQAYMTAFSTWNGSYDVGFDFGLVNGNTITCEIIDPSYGLLPTSNPNYPYTTGTWYHIACVVTPTNYTIYANSAVVGSGNYSLAAPSLYDTDHPITIGSFAGWYNLFNGSIDDVRVYSRALPAGEVAALYNADTIGDGIPNWWRQQYFGSPSTTNGNSCASCDPDGDGLTNLQEYQAGMDPLHSPLPTFSPDGGMYLTAQSVTISCAAVGATIHYTTNGLEPTESDPVVVSAVTVSGPTTLLRAHAFKSGMTTSKTKSALYQIGARVVAGWDYSFALQTNGTLWAWGRNDYGQLGDGTNVNRLFPVVVSGTCPSSGAISNVWAVAGGETHTVAADSKGTVWTWGNNSNGQLGNGTSINYYSPLAISGVSNVMGVAAGQYHTMAVQADGTVWTWGDNSYGQLGIGSSGGNTNVPAKAVGLTQMIGLAAGAYHSVALRSDGTVWAWGYNGNGQLGDGTWTDQSVPEQLGTISNVVAIAAGGYHTVALRVDRTVWTWGYNNYGQLGDGTTTDSSVPIQINMLSNVVAIAAGQYHTLAVTATGQVYAWGYNGNGQLGLGYNDYDQHSTPQLVGSLSGVLAISAGNHSLVVKSDGTIWSWGANGYGQLGHCTTQDEYTPGTVGLSVNSPPPTMAMVSGSATICAGESVNILAALTGTGPWTVVWSDGITQNNVTDNPATNTVSPTSTTTYTVTAVVDSTCAVGVSSGSATITVDHAPSITSQPTNQTVCAGSASFMAAASGSPAPTVQWQVSTNSGATFSDISGATSETLTFSVTTSDNGNKYRAVFSNICGNATSVPATLITGPPLITRQPLSATKCVGESVTFSVVAVTSPLNIANGSAALSSSGLAGLSTDAIAAAAKTANSQQSSKTARFRSDRILVKPKKGLKAARLANQHAAFGAKVKRTHARMGGLQVIKLPPGLTVEKAIDRYQRSGLFEYAEPDYEVQADSTPNDPYYTDGTLWNMNNTGQNGGTADADIDAPEAWDTCTSAAPVIVAVIDTGVRYTHEDLAPNMWVNSGEIPGNGIDDDGNGYVDDVYGINAITDTGDPLFDVNDHGTHVSGIIGAVGNNGKGIVGVAWNVRIMACKFINSNGGAWMSDAIQCIDYAISNGAKIMNNSWGYPYGTPPSMALRDAIIAARDADIIFVVSAGNEGHDYPRYPARYDVDNIVAVAATDRNDLLADFSNFGSNTVDLGAPGVDVYSCYGDDSYGTLSGTSMAAPHVSGALALLCAQCPELNYKDAIAELLATVDPIPSLQGKTVTGGRLNLQKLLTHRQFSYQWYKNGISITGATNSTYTIPSVASADAGSYYVVVTGPCGSAVSSNATLTVNTGCGALSVTPSTGAFFSGWPGGPFFPSIQTYTLTNHGDIALNWQASKSANWVSLSATSGTLPTGSSTSVTVSINSAANGLTADTYSDTVTFTNTTSAFGSTNRVVNLFVWPQE